MLCCPKEDMGSEYELNQKTFRPTKEIPENYAFLKRNVHTSDLFKNLNFLKLFFPIILIYIS